MRRSLAVPQRHMRRNQDGGAKVMREAWAITALRSHEYVCECACFGER